MNFVSTDTFKIQFLFIGTTSNPVASPCSLCLSPSQYFVTHWHLEQDTCCFFLFFSCRHRIKTFWLLSFNEFHPHLSSYWTQSPLTDAEVSHIFLQHVLNSIINLVCILRVRFSSDSVFACITHCHTWCASLLVNVPCKAVLLELYPSTKYKSGFLLGIFYANYFLLNKSLQNFLILWLETSLRLKKSRRKGWVYRPIIISDVIKTQCEFIRKQQEEKILGQKKHRDQTERWTMSAHPRVVHKRRETITALPLYYSGHLLKKNTKEKVKIMIRETGK